MKAEEALDLALEHVVRHDDGSADENTLIDEVARLIDFDEALERRQKAARVVSRRRKPGSTEAVGQLKLPGIDEPYAYEPDRLVADNDGRVIEQRNATTKFKQAEAERARDNARRQLEHAERKTTESEAFAGWAIEQLGKGRAPGTVTYGAFVDESGFWSEGAALPEPDLEVE